MKRFSPFLGGLLAFCLPLSAAQTITIKGSDTMVILNQRWAETYMTTHKNVVIQVTGGGSGTGISALIDGATDICAASRPMKNKEKADLKAKRGGDVVEIPVAKDGVVIYLNTRNPVKELTMEQIRDIYTGKITNWKDVGGKDGKIILYSRENNSGTYMFFKEHVLQNKDYASMAQSLPGTAAVVNAVSKDPKGIGYGGHGYAKGIKFASVKADAASPAVAPDDKSIMSGKYPVSRDLYFYLAAPAQGETKNFLDWIGSADGQKIAVTVGYFPLGKKSAKK